jgi:putative transposase
VVTPLQRRAAVTEIRASRQISERQACRFLGIHRALCRYRSRRPPDSELRAWLRERAQQKPRWGVPRLVWQRRDVEGYPDNHKRIARVYRSEGLAVRRRPRKHLTMPRVSQPVPLHANERWSMDFVRDTLASGRVFRAFTLVDDATREALAIHPGISLPATQVIAVLEAVIAQRGQPKAIVCDNGPEFTGRAMLSWAHQRGIILAYIRPGKPIENAFVESFNGKLRDECLNLHWFLTLADAAYRLEAWRVFFNTERPHKSLGNLTPQQYADKKKTERQNEELTRLSA